LELKNPESVYPDRERRRSSRTAEILHRSQVQGNVNKRNVSTLGLAKAVVSGTRIGLLNLTYMKVDLRMDRNYPRTSKRVADSLRG